MASGVSSSARSHSFRPYRSFAAIVREILKLDKIRDEIEDSKIIWYGHVKSLNTGRISNGISIRREESKRLAEIYMGRTS